MSREILYSLIIFLPVLSAAWLLRKKSPLWQLGLWSLVLLRLVLPPGLSSPVISLDIDAKILSPAVEKSEQSVPPIKGSNLQTARIDTSPQPISAAGRYNESEEHKSSGNSAAHPGWAEVIFFFWLAGFIFTLSLHIRRYRFYRRTVREAPPLKDEPILHMLEDWRRSFKVRRRINIVCPDHPLPPFTVGLSRPVISLPKGLVISTDKTLLQTVLSHEVAHIKHMDELWLRIQNLIQSLYFFYPPAWYANSRINLARECLRDSAALFKGNISPGEFGKGILCMSELNFSCSEYMHGIPGFGNEKKKVSYRLQNLKKKRPRKAQRFLIYTFLLLTGLILIPIFGGSEASGTKPDTGVNRGVERKAVQAETNAGGQRNQRLESQEKENKPVPSQTEIRLQEGRLPPPNELFSLSAQDGTGQNSRVFKTNKQFEHGRETSEIKTTSAVQIILDETHLSENTDQDANQLINSISQDNLPDSIIKEMPGYPLKPTQDPLKDADFFEKAAEIQPQVIRPEQEKRENLLGYLIDERTIKFRKRGKPEVLQALKEAASKLDYAVVAEDEQSVVFSLSVIITTIGYGGSGWNNSPSRSPLWHNQNWISVRLEETDSEDILARCSLVAARSGDPYWRTSLVVLARFIRRVKKLM